MIYHLPSQAFIKLQTPGIIAFEDESQVAHVFSVRIQKSKPENS